MMGIKPCPFCGGEAFIDHVAESLTWKSRVLCKGCGAMGKKYAMACEYSADEKAIEAWNWRADEHQCE